jgi:hypothetical protein
MSWLNSRKQDAQAAITGYVIGQEAHEQDLEELEWSTIQAIAEEQGIDLTDARLSILDKAIDLGFIVKDRIG